MGDNEDDLEDMDLLTKKKLSGTKKGIFTRHAQSFQVQLDLWRIDPEGGHYEARARE